MKSKGLAYFFLIFLGPLGAHKFYLNRPGMGVIYLLTFGFAGIGCIIDLFTLGKAVEIYNLRLAYANGANPRYIDDYREPYQMQPVNHTSNINVNVNIGHGTQEQLRECTRCGAVFSVGPHFCPNCGRQLDLPQQAYGGEEYSVTVIEPGERMPSNY